MNQASSFIIFPFHYVFSLMAGKRNLPVPLPKLLHVHANLYYKGGMGHLPVIILWIKVYYHNIIKILSPDLNFQVIQYLTKNTF